MLVFYLAAIDSDENKNKFEYIYHKYYRFMLRTASSIIRDSALAEDAVHETFVQLLKEIDSLRIDNEKSLQSYLYILLDVSIVTVRQFASQLPFVHATSLSWTYCPIFVSETP